MNTLEQVHQCIRNVTKAFCDDRISFATTEEISQQLNVSRTVISKYLNKLYDDGEMIKIISRPVIYYSASIIRERLRIEKIDREFLSFEEFNAFLSSSQKKVSLKDVIGYDKSLETAVRSLNTFFDYPKETCNMCILRGARGTGKKHLVSRLFEYSKDRGKIASDRFLEIINCDGLKHPEELLFGDGRTRGILEKAAGSVIYLENADKLSSSILHQLTMCVENKGLFEGGTHNVPLKTGVILGVEKAAEDIFPSSLIDAADFVIRIPDFESRTYREKEDMARRFLLEEEKKLGKTILISNYAFSALAHASYKNNIDGLSKEIKTACANANYTSDDHAERIEINLYHFSEEMLKESSNTDTADDRRMLTLNDHLESSFFDRVLGYYDDILNTAGRFKIAKISEKEAIQSINNILNQYCDFIIFGKNPSNQRIETYRSLIDHILELVSKKYNIAIYSNCAYLLARLIYKETYVDKEIQRWEEAHAEELRFVTEIYRKNAVNTYSIAMEISDIIGRTIGIELNSINVIFLMKNIHFFTETLGHRNRMGLVIAHGYSTASSIVDSVNRLLGQNVFFPMDMPLDVQVSEIAARIRNYISNRADVEEVILLVDMGSLEQIGDMLVDSRNIRIGVINNISTKVVLQVGELLLKGEELITLLRRTCEGSTVDYEVYENNKKNAILFTTEFGETTTERLIETFKASIPKELNLWFIACDGAALKQNTLTNPIFDEYNILMITGTVPITMKEIPYFAIEDMVAFKDIEILNRIFRQYLTEDEIKAFNNNLIKNFSVGNLMNNLTILNAEMLLNYIEEAVEQLQRNLLTTFSTKIKLRLYIHVSCLVERLVTKQPTLEYADIDKFMEKNEAFVNIFEKSFSLLCEHYFIKIPRSEIAYLYGYMYEEYTARTLDDEDAKAARDEMFSD